MSIRVLIAVCVMLAPVLKAEALNPPALPGWEGGVSLGAGPVGYSSPAIAEIDGNASNGKEIAVASGDGHVYVYRADGSLVWSGVTPNSGCAGSLSTQKIISSPAVGDLAGTGVPQVVIGYGGLGSKSCDGGVIAFRGSDGALTWNFSIQKFSKRQRFWAFRHSVVSSPALADVDGDGKMEIGFGSFDRNIYLLNYNGKARWYYNAADTVWSSPAFGDVNGDGRRELVAASDISQNKRLKPPTPDGGFLYALKTTRARRLGIGFRDRSAYYWQSSAEQVFFSSPVIADVAPQNPGLEVVIGSGCFFPQNSSNKRGKWFKVFSASTGKLISTLPTTACSSSSAAVADLDGDGLAEIVATVNGSRGIGGDGIGKVYAWKAANPSPFWVAYPQVGGSTDSLLGDYKSPAVADLDGNGSLEVIAASGSGITILNGADGSPLTCNDADCSNSDLALRTPSRIQSTPAVGDLNNDGQLEVVAAGANRSGKGALYVWTNFSSVLNSAAGPAAPNSAPWPMTRGNARHTGLFGD